MKVDRSLNVLFEELAVRYQWRNVLIEKSKKPFPLLIRAGEYGKSFFLVIGVHGWIELILVHSLSCLKEVRELHKVTDSCLLLEPEAQVFELFNHVNCFIERCERYCKDLGLFL